MYDRYKGVRELMPYAKAVSAKSHEFDDKGNEVKPITWNDENRPRPYYNGYVGVEYEGSRDATKDLLTKALLERVRDQLS